MSKKKSYVPPIPRDRLEAMQLALIRHIFEGQAYDCEPLSADMAREIEDVIALLISGPRRPTRATQENLRAAAVARGAMKFFKVPQEVAVALAFDNPNGVDVDSLARTYRNLLPLLRKSDWGTAAELNKWLTAWYRPTTTKNGERRGPER